MGRGDDAHLAHPRRAGRRGRRAAPSATPCAPSSSSSARARLPEGMLPAGHGPRRDARPDGADAGQDERRDVRAAGRPGRRHARDRDGQRHRGRAAAGAPTGPSRCCPPTSRRSPTGLGVDLDQVRHLPRRPRGRPGAAVLRGAVDRAAAGRRGARLRPRHQHRHRPHRDAPCSRSTRATPTALQSALQDQLFRPDPSPAQRAALARLETYLALVEGWVDVVADRATREHLPQSAALGEAVRRRRATGGPAEKAFAGLVGLELRPRRLRDAANLWAALEAKHGADGRDAAWGHPDVAPTGADLDDPLGYVERFGTLRAAPTSTRPSTSCSREGEAAGGRRLRRRGDGRPVTAPPTGVPAAYLALRDDATARPGGLARARRPAGAAARASCSRTAASTPDALWKQGPPAAPHRERAGAQRLARQGAADPARQGRDVAAVRRPLRARGRPVGARGGDPRGPRGVRPRRPRARTPARPPRPARAAGAGFRPVRASTSTCGTPGVADDEARVSP